MVCIQHMLIGVVYLQCLSWSLGYAGEVVFENIPPHQTAKVLRIHENAPKGTKVFSIRAYYLEDGNIRKPVLLYIRGPDKSNFKMVDNNILVKSNRISRPVGYKYVITVVAVESQTQRHKVGFMRFYILVSKVNRYKPKLVLESLIGEVSRYARSGNVIGHLAVTDADSDYYNRHSVFLLMEGPYARYVSVNETTGEVRTTRLLLGFRNQFALQVVAKNTGSPALYTAANMTVHIRNISAPENIWIKYVNLTYADVCWTGPVYGRYDGFILSCYGNHNSNQFHHTTYVNRSSTPACSFMTNLLPWREYSLKIRAYNRLERGIAKELKFRTEYNACRMKPCKNGECSVIKRSPGYICSCHLGYFGQQCERQAPCAVNPCRHNGTCYNTSESAYGCACQEGYYGINCSLENSCITKDPCFNGAQCVNRTHGYQCTCQPGFNGVNCEKIIRCELSPCYHGAICRYISATQYACHCTRGYYGRLCQLFDPCSRSPCKNNGMCQNLTQTEYRCVCPNGYYGDDCGHFNPCATTPCYNDGHCTNLSETNFVCKCKFGFYGPLCQSYNPCHDNPCKFGGFCNSVDGQFFCDCPLGLYGRRCENMRICEFEQPCRNGGTCVSLSEHTYTCACTDGWHGQNCSELNVGISCDCENNATCVPGEDESGICACHDGYYGAKCERRDPCFSSPCENKATCVNITDSEFQCKCVPGYTGVLCENETDECASSPCQNEAKCVDDLNSFKCACKNGYIGNLCEIPVTCPMEVIQEIDGVYIWPETPHGEAAEVECPSYRGNYAYRVCVIMPNSSAEWLGPDNAQCLVLIQARQDAKQRLLIWLQNTDSRRSAAEIERMTGLLENITVYGYDDEELAKDMVRVIDEIVEYGDMGIAPLNVSVRVRHVIDDMLNNLPMHTNDSTIALETHHIRLLVRKIDTNRLSNGVTFEPEMKDSPKLILSPEVLSIAMREKDFHNRVEFAYFKSGWLFQDKLSPNCTPEAVISASVPGVSVQNLESCITYTIPNRQNGGVYKCVYWDNTASRWSTQGVIRIHSEPAFTTCCSTHLTNFAVIMDEEVAINDYVQPLILLMYIACGAAVLSVFLTFLTYAMFRYLNREKSGQLLIQLCISLLAQNTLFFLDSNQHYLISGVVCIVVAKLVHYFVLTSMMWVILDARILHQMLTNSPSNNGKLFLLRRCILAWGLPVVCVAIAVTVNFKSLSENTEVCRPSPHFVYTYYATYLGPACVMAVTCIVMFCMIVKASCSTSVSKEVRESVQMSHVAGSLLLIIFMTTALGAHLTRDLYHNVYAYYVFWISLAMVGVTIFMFRVIFSSYARAAWCRRDDGGKKKNQGRQTSKRKRSDRCVPKTKKQRDYKLVSNGTSPSPVAQRKMNHYTTERPMRSLDISNLDENGKEMKPIVKYNSSPNNKSRSWLHSNYSLLADKDDVSKDKEDMDYHQTYTDSEWMTSTKL